MACEGVVATDGDDLGGWKRCALRPGTGEKMECCEGGGVGKTIVIVVMIDGRRAQVAISRRGIGDVR